MGGLAHLVLKPATHKPTSTAVSVGRRCRLMCRGLKGCTTCIPYWPSWCFLVCSVCVHVWCVCVSVLCIHSVITLNITLYFLLFVLCGRAWEILSTLWLLIRLIRCCRDNCSLICWVQEAIYLGLCLCCWWAVDSMLRPIPTVSLCHQGTLLIHSAASYCSRMY